MDDFNSWLDSGDYGGDWLSSGDGYSNGYQSDGFDLNNLDAYSTSASPFLGTPDTSWYTGQAPSGTMTVGTNGITDLSGVNNIGWGNIAKSLLGVGGLYLNDQANRNAQNELGAGLQQMFQQVDPFSASRPGYVNDLNNFMSNPSSYLQTPYAQSVLNAGAQTVGRSQAARGYLGSGNEAIALQRQGMQDASGLLQQQFNNLYNLSGAGVGQIAGADVLGNIAGLNAAKATNTAATYNNATGYNPNQPQSSKGGGGIGSTLGTAAGSIFGGPIGGAVGGVLGGLLDNIF